MPETNTQMFEPEDDKLSITSEEYHNINKEDRYNMVCEKMSATKNAYCINAITKQPYPYKINSKEAKENLWCVMNSSGKRGRKDSLKEYYDSKEQYFRHRKKQDRTFKLTKKDCSGNTI